MSETTRNQAEGERRKAAALDLLAQRRAVYVRRGQRALIGALLCCGSATSDEVRACVELPVGIDPVCLGAVPAALTRAGIVYRAGYAPTCRPSAHRRPVSVWALADHPDLPDPGNNEDSEVRQGSLFRFGPHGIATPAAGTAGAARR